MAQVVIEGRGYFEVLGSYYPECGRCGGGGMFGPQSIYSGKCFDCGGHGYHGKAYTHEAATKRGIALSKAQAKRQEKRDAEHAARADAAMARWEAEQAEEAKHAAAKAEAAAKFEFYGEVGEKLQFDGEVVRVHGFDTQYGRSYLVIFKVSETVEIKTFTTAQWLNEVEVGEKVTMVATVKAHEEYEGKKGTLVARPKMIGKVA